jgi:hypothetical protein
MVSQVLISFAYQAVVVVQVVPAATIIDRAAAVAEAAYHTPIMLV